MAISGQDWAMPATASTARAEDPIAEQRELRCDKRRIALH